MRPSRFLPLLAALAFAGCAAAEEPAAPEGFLVDIQELDVSFRFHEELSLRASQDEALLSGATTRMEVSTRPYGEPGKPARPEGLGMWELRSGIAGRVRDERSCEPLKDPSVYLPVDTSLPMRCDLVLDPTGRVVVWMVGLGRPFEELPFLQSGFLVLRDDGYLAFSYVYPLPESDATVQWVQDTFKDRHPGMGALIWPNKSYMLLADETRRTLEKQINPASAEVNETMDRLRDLAFSAGPSRASPDR